ncbi:MAG: hypothetical protein ACM3NQ_15880 [Bacteroidales bacterium]
MNGMTFYAGFSGGGFDEIRMWDEGGVRNSFAVDAIELRDSVARSSSLAAMVRAFLAFLASIIWFLIGAQRA